jgi:hypothetical protein
MCGNLALPQFGQRLRAGADNVQFDARRLRLLALLVFFFGTAIAGSCAKWTGRG